jgi:hypothetical protein
MLKVVSKLVTLESKQCLEKSKTRRRQVSHPEDSTKLKTEMLRNQLET